MSEAQRLLGGGSTRPSGRSGDDAGLVDPRAVGRATHAAVDAVQAVVRVPAPSAAALDPTVEEISLAAVRLTGADPSRLAGAQDVAQVVDNLESIRPAPRCQVGP